MANRLFGNGTTVTLYEKTAIGTDAFNREMFEETPVLVHNVLIAPVTSTEEIDTINLSGKQAIYVLGIPKGDTHEWADRKVEFFNQEFHSIRESVQGIDELIPGPWNKKVWVEINE